MKRRGSFLSSRFLFNLLYSCYRLFAFKPIIITKNFLILLTINLRILRQLVLTINQIVNIFLRQFDLPRMLFHRVNWIKTSYYWLLIALHPVGYRRMVQLLDIKRTSHRLWTLLKIYLRLPVELVV